MLSHMASMLNQLDYKRVLHRGFAIVRDENGTPITSVKNTEYGENISVEMHDGDVKATIDS